MKRFYKALVWVIFLMPVAIFFLAVYFGIPERIVRYDYAVVGLQFLAMLITTILCAVASWRSDSRFWARLFGYFIVLLLFGLIVFKSFGYETMFRHDDDKWVMPIIFFDFLIFAIATTVYSIRLIAQANRNKKKNPSESNQSLFVVIFIGFLLISFFTIITAIVSIYFVIMDNLAHSTPIITTQLNLTILTFYPTLFLLLSNFYFKISYTKDAWTNDFKYAYWGTSTFCFSNIGFFCMVLLTKFYEPIYFDHPPQSIFMYLLAATIDTLFVMSLGLISLGALKRIEMAESERKIIADNFLTRHSQTRFYALFLRGGARQLGLEKKLPDHIVKHLRLVYERHVGRLLEDHDP